MNEGEDEPPRAFGGLTTEEAFSLVGNEIRREILLALSDVGDDRNPPTLSFSELYERVDTDVNTSQFNYHLQQLLGHFVESRAEDTAHLNEEFTADEQGAYALRPEGLLLMWTVRASTGEDPDLPRFAVGTDCHHCGEPIEATYENSLFKIECTECGYHYDYNLTPPGVVHGTEDHDEILSRVAGYNRSVRSGFARGVCPLCAGRVDERFVDPAETRYPGRDKREVLIHRACDHCGNIDYLTVGEFLLTDAGLVSFCYERGLDVLDGPLWELPFVATDECVTVVDTDPWEVTFALTLEGDSLRISLDESLSALERTIN
jgi:Zn ribbon nucleic-acid-binding protein